MANQCLIQNLWGNAGVVHTRIRHFVELIMQIQERLVGFVSWATFFTCLSSSSLDFLYLGATILSVMNHW